MNGRILRYSTAAVLLTTLGFARVAQAQLTDRLKDVRLDGQLGFAFPAGQLNAYENGGPSVGVDLAYPMTDRVDVALDGEVDLMSGSSEHRAPDMRLYRYEAGVEADVLRPSSRNWKLESVAGLGATTFRSNEFIVDAQAERFTHTYFTGTAGVELAFGTNSALSGYISGMASWSPVKKSDTEILRALDPGVLGTFSSAISLPVSLGFKATI